MTAYGSQEMSANLMRVLMRRPGASLASADPVKWHYGPTFDGEKAVRQYHEFASLVEKSGAEILWLEDKGDGLADAMFTHDPSLMSDHGAILLRMGKPLREKETALHEAAYKKAGIPILGRIESPGTVEGGDCIWLKEWGITLIQAPADEFHASNGLSLNVLPVRPNEVIMVAGFPKTKAAMEAAGCKVETFEADALCIACEGGPTCLTRPVLRRAA